MVLGWGALLACTTEVEADFRLTLVPRLLDDQRAQVLALDPDVKLLVRPEAGELDVRYAGTAADGEPLALEGLGPIAAGTRLGLILERPGDAPGFWIRSETVAYGEIQLDGDLALGGQEVELPVYLPRVDALGRVGSLPGAQRRGHTALAVLADRRAFVFGGVDPSDVGAASDGIVALPPSDEGWAAPVEVAKLPEGEFVSDEGDPYLGRARVGATATAIETSGGPRVVIVGGRAGYDAPTDATASWSVWDPDSLDVEAGGTMSVTRSDHLALPLTSGEIVVFGGIEQGSPGGGSTFEVLTVDPPGSVPGAVDLAGAGDYGAFGVSVGDAAVVCTGGRVASDVIVPSDVCVRVGADGSVEPLDPLPEAVFGGAVAALPDGGLLVTGGIAGRTDEPDERIATGRAYRWSAAKGWSTLSGMVYPRAQHVMVGLPDGRVLVVGGVEQVGAFGAQTGARVQCTEVFDPETETFAQTTCGDLGSGQLPAVSIGGGVGLVVQGLQYDGLTAIGGEGIGVFGLIPVIDP